jgi:hypothetical protein
MFLRKPAGGMRNTVDLRARNDNTEKMASPLPDQDGIRCRVARSKYFTAMDLEGAYEQVRVEPDDVRHTLMATPDGTMVSLVLQQGDCNAIATFMAVMTDMFGLYIGVWLEIYLDDLLVHNDDLNEHVRCVKLVIDILKANEFYLSEKKMHFLALEIKLLGHIVTHEGIRLDPAKIDKISAWKVPTNRDLLRGFLGAVGYLADRCAGIRIPMDVLNRLTGDNIVYRWGPTEQRAFDEIKRTVQDHRDVVRIAMTYGEGALPVHVVTDGCLTGVGGCIKQGVDWKMAPVVAFYSAKLSAAQQNYAVHEIELLAGLETMMRYRDVLLGVQFQWYMDHKGLIHFMNQKNLTGRQARWLEKLSEFDFRIVYVPGLENGLADSLSRIYSSDDVGTVRASSEMVQFDDHRPVPSGRSAILAGLEARMATLRPRTLKVPPAESRMPTSVRRRNEKPKGHVTGKSTSEDHTIAHPATSNRQPELPVESGRPETSAEFAKRIRKVTLRLPGQRQEGESIVETSTNVNGSKELESINDDESSGLNDRPAPSLIESPLDDEGIHTLPNCLKGKYSDDKFFKLILEDRSQFKNFVIEDDVIYLKESGMTLLCIPDCVIGRRSVRELIIDRAHSILAHLGATKTIAYLRSSVWWKTMVPDVRTFCDSCPTCRWSKPSNQKPYGLLNPLPVPLSPWEAIGIDFVGPLPDSKD